MTFEQAQQYCETMTKRSGSNFVHSFSFLSQRQRDAMYAVYAFCREIDSVVDDPAPGVDRRARLQQWRDQLSSMYTSTPTLPVAIGLAKHARVHAIPLEYFEELVNGVEMDLTITRYATFDDLFQYCYRVASVVGLICLRVFGARSPQAADYAINLGVAFQLTNILRDLGVDADRGRIYVPQEDLARFGYSERQLLEKQYTPAFLELMRFQSERAREFYARAEAALRVEDLKALLVAEMMRGVYFQMLRRIEREEYRVFHHRMRISSTRKAWIAAYTWCRVTFRHTRHRLKSNAHAR